MPSPKYISLVDNAQLRNVSFHYDDWAERHGIIYMEIAAAGPDFEEK